MDATEIEALLVEALQDHPRVEKVRPFEDRPDRTRLTGVKVDDNVDGSSGYIQAGT